MDKMRAVIFKEHGDLDRLQYTYVQRPKIGKRDVLVKVKACALNHLDLWALNGLPGVKIPLPHILGCDIAGEIESVGSKVWGLTLKRPVLIAPGLTPRKAKLDPSRCWDSLSDAYQIVGLQTDGGYAEYVSVPHENVIPVSTRWSYEEWAAIPLVFMTAWHMLITRAGLKKKEKVLIQAAGSGVGSAAVQIAKHFGAQVIATVGSDWKMKRAKEIGADHVINYSKTDLVAEVKKITGGKGVEVAVEHVGPATFSQSLACLAKKGRMVTCGVTSGPTASLDLRFLFSRQISVFGCYMGGLHELKHVIQLVEKKRLRPVVDKIFPLGQAREALHRMKNRENFGKIVLATA